MSQHEHLDVVILGAGISGIGAAAHLAMELPDRTYAVLERRDAIGGTWDLFRYPGVRSDSDMHTLGYRFRSWPEDKILADGPSIKRYVEETAAEYDVDKHIRFGHAVTGLSWDSETARWTVSYEVAGEAGSLTADFVWSCTGYYSYDEPYAPEFTGQEDFAGELVHPQFWPEDLDVTGKKVAVIGSGATAITIVPAIAGTTEHVTMVQRTPTYVMTVPGVDPVASYLRKVLPTKVVAGITRWRNVTLQAGLYQASRRRPNEVRKLIRRLAVRQLPKDYDVDVHFKPPYNPWDQRLCVVADGDLFRVIRNGTASIATGTIERFEKDGIRMSDGSLVEADIIVTATGLRVLSVGGLDVLVDGERVEVSERMAYRGALLEGVPNFAYVFGYTNASWTLKADLVSELVVRLLKEMRARGSRAVVARRPDDVNVKPLLDLDSGYVQRAQGQVPLAGDKGYWKSPQNYFKDIVRMRFGALSDDALEFTS